MRSKETTVEKIELLQKKLNARENVPRLGYRRNVSVYELVCYLNNITGCYISKNFGPIPVFIERARNYINENEAEELMEYYNLASEYLNTIEDCI